MTRGAAGAARATRLALLPLLLGGCGGGAPLLYPAHTLNEGDVTFAAGTSGRFALGGLHTAERRLDEAATLPGGAVSESERTGFVQGAIARFSVAPGVAPFVGGRVGLGQHNEAGLTYTGRGFRLDGRHALEWQSVALSFGLAASAVLARPGKQPDGPPLANPGDTGLRTASVTSCGGYGLDLPLLFGYRSDADVVKAWIGVRAGFERAGFNVLLVEAPDSAHGTTARATRFWGGGLVGFSVGLSPIEVGVEVDSAYESASGDIDLQDGKLSGSVAGLSLTPAMAISAKF